jgi:lipopolysaccharide transport system ATP-binding protein
VVGLIGRNGAGKSTLLKVLSRITEPTEGFAEIRGRVGSLLEVGTGFHPELTGRENVYLNGAILGMHRAEIDSKFDEIVDFAEVERFIDTPVKFYSSGMFVRLAFAVAAHLEPEILFVDEVLAVGDSGFQKKCLGKMESVARSGRTVVLVSHNMGAIAELCSHGVLLEGGHVARSGLLGPVIEEYGNLLAGSQGEQSFEDMHGRAASLTAARMLNGHEAPCSTFDLEDDVIIEFDYRVRERLHGLQVSVTIARNFIDIVRTFDTDGADDPLAPVDPGEYRSRLVVPKRFLKAGHYTVDVNIGTPQEILHDVPQALAFDVEEQTENTHSRGYRRDRPGHFIFPGRWEFRRFS